MKKELKIYTNEDEVGVLHGLPKNWAVSVRAYHEEGEFLDEDLDERYSEYMADHVYCGEIYAPKFTKPELDKLYNLIYRQVRVWGRKQFTSILNELEQCRGH